MFRVVLIALTVALASIGKWHVKIKERTFIITVVAGPIFAEYGGVFIAMIATSIYAWKQKNYFDD